MRFIFECDVLLVITKLSTKKLFVCNIIANSYICDTTSEKAGPGNIPAPISNHFLIDLLMGRIPYGSSVRSKIGLVCDWYWTGHGLVLPD